ncbi:fascin-like [Discoglossus pictus]
MVISVGLLNSSGRYLTTEHFLFHVNATAVYLRPHQVWDIEFQREDMPLVCLRSSFHRYLTADNNGKVACDQESPGLRGLFLLVQHKDGRVSFQSEMTKRYLGGVDMNIICFAEVITETEKWTIHLSRHPIVNIMNLGTSRYLRHNRMTSSVSCDMDLPWGPECVMSIYFDFKERKYGIQASNGHLIAFDGTLHWEPGTCCLYFLELHYGVVTLRDPNDRYLTGRENIVRSFSIDKPGQDEFFHLASSPAQVSLWSISNKRYLCCRPDSDAFANQQEVRQTEMLQILASDGPSRVSFRTIAGYYLTCTPYNTIITSSEQNDKSFFKLQYHGRKVSFSSADGRLVTVKPNGLLSLSNPPAGPTEHFVMRLVNRPLLILQSDFGFVGLAPGTHRLDGNRPFYDASEMNMDEKGYCHLKELSTGKYWALENDGLITATGDQPSKFTVEIWGSDTLVLRAQNKKYMVAAVTGEFKASALHPDGATAFRY